eukprot:3062165-Pyramimonas_sp.AAC.1
MLNETACFVHKARELFNHQWRIIFASPVLVAKLFKQDRMQRVTRDPRGDGPSAVFSASVQMQVHRCAVTREVGFADIPRGPRGRFQIQEVPSEHIGINAVDPGYTNHVSIPSGVVGRILLVAFHSVRQ